MALHLTKKELTYMASRYDALLNVDMHAIKVRLIIFDADNKQGFPLNKLSLTV